MTAASPSSVSDLLSIDVAGSDSAVRLVLVGEVDSSTAPALQAALDSALADGRDEVTIDLCRVTFLDSAGLCVLAAGHRRSAEQAIRLRILASGRAVVRPLQITGLWDLLAVEPVEPDADSAA